MRVTCGASPIALMLVHGTRLGGHSVTNEPGQTDANGCCSAVNDVSFGEGELVVLFSFGGLRTSKDSLHQYLSHLKDCFPVRKESLETGSERQRMVKASSGPTRL